MPDDAHAPEQTIAALEEELGRLRDKAARLELLARHLSASAELQGLRAGARVWQADQMRQEVALMQSSRVWRATLPFRLALDLARGAPPGASAEALRVRGALAAMRRDGIAASVSRLGRRLSSRTARPAAPSRALAPAPDEPAAAEPSKPCMPSPSLVLAPSMLIIAELSLPQCAKYRVWQRQEMVQRLGRPCRVVDWRFEEDCLSAASLATQVVLYRVPGYAPVLRLIERLHRLAVPVAWEVDDLIFDRALFLQNRNVDSLDPGLREGVLSGVTLYRDAMAACGSGIASTPCLADTMRDAGLAETCVIENALDAETLRIASGLRERRRGRPPRRGMVIAYGSGTKTHDADFREAASALLRLLRLRPDVTLRVVGELNLPAGFEAFGDRVERLPPVPYPRYLALLAESDVSIAPLESTPFNDSKSNIKFIEAAILGVPSVCSPRAHFTHVMADGQNGLLADGEQQWFDALSGLAGDAQRRNALGDAALQTALQRYDPDAIARTQVMPLLARAPDQRPSVHLRIVAANVYFAPRSYGGATLVVEEMARRLHRQAGTEVHIVTSALHPSTRETIRSDQDGMAVFALPTNNGEVVAEFDDPAAGAAFGQVLDAVQPHVVHLHSVQWLSARLALACAERKIPYVITLHDAWWLCARQFMVMENGRYCHQTTIDLRVCQNCVSGARHLQQRDALMRASLDGAALLLSPSRAHRDLHLANGVPADKIIVAPNGVRRPLRRRAARRPGTKLRFAYVGGAVEVKGFSIVKRGFEALQRSDWKLVLVDNTLNLGFSSVDAAQWTVQGTLSVVPAYTQDGIDDFFDGVDVLVFPSQWKESFGLTVREALVRDVWVIATQDGGPAEAIIDGVNGTLIPLDGRHEPLTQAVQALLAQSSMFDGYTNRQAGEIIDYDVQATALRATLAEVVERHARTEQMSAS